MMTAALLFLITSCMRHFTNAHHPSMWLHSHELGIEFPKAQERTLNHQTSEQSHGSFKFKQLTTCANSNFTHLVPLFKYRMTNDCIFLLMMRQQEIEKQLYQIYSVIFPCMVCILKHSIHSAIWTAVFSSFQFLFASVSFFELHFTLPYWSLLSCCGIISIKCLSTH